MKRNLFLLLTTLFFISCQDELIQFDNKFVFLEQHTSEYSEFLKGNVCAHICIDFPMYNYNQNSKTLTNWGNLELTKNTMMLLGAGGSASGVASSGAGTQLYEVQELPYLQYNLAVTRIEDDGTVHFTYKDSAMVLLPNEEWTKTWTKQDTAIYEEEDWEYYYLTGILEIRPDTTIIQYTYHDRVTNWGKLAKEDIDIFEY